MVVALLGLGTVGKAVYEAIREGFLDIEIKYVLVRSPENKAIDKDLLVTDYNIILEDNEVECVIEMMGASCSYEYMKRAIAARKHVITANKEVIAMHYPELKGLAILNDVELLFEASVGGGIPIISTLLKEGMYNKVDRIEGILNGTTNFILTSMHKEKIDFSEALAIAQMRGFAEADPTADLEGLDMVRKIAILSMIAYNSKIDLNKIYHMGITNVNKSIIEFIDLLGYRLKLMASSSLKNNIISISVEPTLVKADSLFAGVDYEYNLVRYNGSISGSQVMYGKGAGDKTANSILYDLANLAMKERVSFIPANTLCCNGNYDTFSKYLLEVDGKIDNNIIEKRLGSMVITKKISGLELEKLLPNVSFSARFID